MDIFIQQVINGLVLGSMYALIALGYTMVYGIINLINFAHGEVMMVENPSKSNRLLPPAMGKVEFGSRSGRVDGGWLWYANRNTTPVTITIAVRHQNRLLARQAIIR